MSIKRWASKHKCLSEHDGLFYFARPVCAGLLDLALAVVVVVLVALRFCGDGDCLYSNCQSCSSLYPNVCLRRDSRHISPYVPVTSSF